MNKFLIIARQAMRFVLMAVAVFTIYYNKDGDKLRLILILVGFMAAMVLSNLIFNFFIKRQEEKEKEEEDKKES